MIKWQLFASQAEKVDGLQRELNKEKQKLDSWLDELGEDSKKHGYTLWRREDNTYFWENRYHQIANYEKLNEAIIAYGTENIDF